MLMQSRQNKIRPDLGEDCPGNSGDNNPNREQQECDVTAGSNDKRVEGQFKKEC